MDIELSRSSTASGMYNIHLGEGELLTITEALVLLIRQYEESVVRVLRYEKERLNYKQVSQRSGDAGEGVNETPYTANEDLMVLYNQLASMHAFLFQIEQELKTDVYTT